MKPLHMTRDRRDSLRRSDLVTDPSVSERAALELAVTLEPGAAVVSWRAQAVAFRYVRIFGLEATLARLGGVT